MTTFFTGQIKNKQRYFCVRFSRWRKNVSSHIQITMLCGSQCHTCFFGVFDALYTLFTSIQPQKSPECWWITGDTLMGPLISEMWDRGQFSFVCAEAICRNSVDVKLSSASLVNKRFSVCTWFFSPSFAMSKQGIYVAFSSVQTGSEKTHLWHQHLKSQCFVVRVL